MNKFSRLLINFPKNLTLDDFLKFIHNETNIPLGLMKLYEYETGCTSIDSIIKHRSDFELIPIDEDRLKKTFIEYTNYFKKHIISFFLFVDDDTDKLKVLNINSSNSNEEFKIEEKLVLISREINKFTFCRNDINRFSQIKNFYFDDGLTEYKIDKNSKLIFIKEFDESSAKFKITKILHINISNITDFHSLYEKLKSYLVYKYNIDFLIECTCLSELNDKTYNLSMQNYKHILEKKSALIIIPVPKIENELILNKLEEMYDTIYIDIYCPSRKSYIKNKLALNIKKCYDESSIKSNILNEIKTKKLFKKFIDLTIYSMNFKRV